MRGGGAVEGGGLEGGGDVEGEVGHGCVWLPC